MGCLQYTHYTARKEYDKIGGKSSAPPAPNYGEVAQAQGGSNLQGSIASNLLSNPTQITPYGTKTLSQTGVANMDNLPGVPAFSVPTYTSNIDFSPQGRQLFDSQTAVQQGLANLGNQSIGTVQNVMGQPFNYNGPGIQTDPTQAQTTAYNAAKSRLDPQWNQRSDMLNTSLVNQGLHPGTEAYDSAMRDFNFGRNDAYQQAQNSAYSQGLAGATFGNQAQQQAYGQALQQRELPLNEISALMSGSQVQQPQFQNYASQQVGAAPTFGGAQAQGSYLNNAYNQQVSQQNALTSGLFGLGSSGLMYAAMAA